MASQYRKETADTIHRIEMLLLDARSLARKDSLGNRVWNAAMLDVLGQARKKLELAHCRVERADKHQARGEAKAESQEAGD